MDFINLKNKRVVIMGLGLYEQGSGSMAAQFFAKRGAKVLVTDLRSKKDLTPALRRLRGFKNIKYVLGRHRKQDFINADIIFQNPSVPAGSPYLKIAKKAGTPIVNDWSIFLSLYAPKIFVGVTGTRGKSTTTALIYEMLKKYHSHIRANVRMVRGIGRVRLAGNLGVSPLSFIDTYKDEPIVAELSSWLLHHFPAVKKSPRVAIVTNIMRDHLDKYPSMKEYIIDKSSIYKFQTPNDFVILNRDNFITRRLGREAPSQKFWFSKKEFLKGDGCFLRAIQKKVSPKNSYTSILRSIEVYNGDIVFRRKNKERVICKISDIKLPGVHNLENILAAVCAACIYGVPKKIIRQTVRSFCGLPNRLELVRELRGVKYYNDTTATTPDATIAALTTLGQRKCKMQNAKCKNIVLIAGGADKKLIYVELARYIKHYCKAVVLLQGTATKKLELRIKNYGLETVKANSMKEAVKAAKTLSSHGDIVLLSPAAASFGLFKNEFDRGKQFRKIVKSLK